MMDPTSLQLKRIENETLEFEKDLLLIKNNLLGYEQTAIDMRNLLILYHKKTVIDSTLQQYPNYSLLEINHREELNKLPVQNLNVQTTIPHHFQEKIAISEKKSEETSSPKKRKWSFSMLFNKTTSEDEYRQMFEEMYTTIQNLKNDLSIEFQTTVSQLLNTINNFQEKEAAYQKEIEQLNSIIEANELLLNRENKELVETMQARQEKEIALKKEIELLQEKNKSLMEKELEYQREISQLKSQMERITERKQNGKESIRQQKNITTDGAINHTRQPVRQPQNNQRYSPNPSGAFNPFRYNH